jgi:UDP-N-acetylglucosamine--N-acetylmuramyl-(pentapeptide) pyrophosphoryl-undecaprenol N-acetylglucosamine transferase
LWYQVVRYEDRMELGYAAADLVLARAGAVTIAELAATGQPALLVPWPLATEDHQTANARVLAAAGGAVVIPEPELTPERLTAEVDRLQADPAALAAMSTAARLVGRRDAAAAVAELVERHALPPRETRA